MSLKVVILYLKSINVPFTLLQYLLKIFILLYFQARSLKKSCPKEASTLFLPAVCINAYLERLRKIDFDIFNEKLRKRNNVLHIQLYWNKLLSKY